MQENKNRIHFFEAGLSLGSNLGDRIANLQAAVTAIAEIPQTIISGLSPIYETEPVGVKPEYQDMPYLNAVVVVKTELLPADLSHLIHDIEMQLGRLRTEDRFAPRIIDIDILYIGQIISDAPDLTLPHPRWAQRRFVLQPLADLRPHLRIPGSRKTVSELLAALPENSEAVRPITDKLANN